MKKSTKKDTEAKRRRRRRENEQKNRRNVDLKKRFGAKTGVEAGKRSTRGGIEAKR